MRKWSPPRKSSDAELVSRPSASFAAKVVSQVCGVGVTDESLTAVWSADERGRLDLAHVAVVFERSSRLVSVFGPFVGPVEASAFADRYAFEIVDVVPGGMEVVVAPLDPGV